jgi:hypothetical protein
MSTIVLKTSKNPRLPTAPAEYNKIFMDQLEQILTLYFNQVDNAISNIITGSVISFQTSLSGLSPSTPSAGIVILSGTLNPASGGTGATTLTGYVYGNGTGAMTASSTIPTTSLSGTITNAQLANSSITINGNSVSLGGSTTVSANTSNPLTISTGLSGTSFNGSAPVTIAISNTTVTAGSYGSASNTLSATVNAQGQLTALSAAPIAIANTQVSGLGTMSTQNIGITATITTAKLTTLGSNGSMTFTNGILTAQTQAT